MGSKAAGLGRMRVCVTRLWDVLHVCGCVTGLWELFAWVWVGSKAVGLGCMRVCVVGLWYMLACVCVGVSQGCGTCLHVFGSVTWLWELFACVCVCDKAVGPVGMGLGV